MFYIQKINGLELYQFITFFKWIRAIAIYRWWRSLYFSKSNSFPFNRDYVSRAFKKVVRKADLREKIHIHILRHSFASNLALKGVPITVLKDLLGHSSIVVTQIYSYSNMDSLKSAIQKFDELIPVVWTLYFTEDSKRFKTTIIVIIPAYHTLVVLYVIFRNLLLLEKLSLIFTGVLVR